MIFVTVGTQLPFDRLLKCVDDYFAKVSGHEVIAQVGNSKYKPKNMKTKKTLSISEFEALFDSADVIISHAGMGSILTSLCASKPICIMPREVRYKEHRNDHQLGTTERFKHYDGCFVFTDDRSFSIMLNKANSYAGSSNLSSEAPTTTIENLGVLINNLASS